MSGWDFVSGLWVPKVQTQFDIVFRNSTTVGEESAGSAKLGLVPTVLQSLWGSV